MLPVPISSGVVQGWRRGLAGIQHCMPGSRPSWASQQRTACKDACVPLENSFVILYHPAGLVSSGQVPASLGCIRLHTALLEAFVLWSTDFIVQVFPLLWYAGPLLHRAMKGSWLHMNMSKYKNQNTKEEQLIHCQGASGTGEGLSAQCSTALSEVPPCYCRHRKPYSCVSMAPGQTSLSHWVAE